MKCVEVKVKDLLPGMVVVNREFPWLQRLVVLSPAPCRAKGYYRVQMHDGEPINRYGEDSVPVIVKEDE